MTPTVMVICRPFGDLTRWCLFTKYVDYTVFNHKIKSRQPFCFVYTDYNLLASFTWRSAKLLFTSHKQHKVAYFHTEGSSNFTAIIQRQGEISSSSSVLLFRQQNPTIAYITRTSLEQLPLCSKKLKFS